MRYVICFLGALVSLHSAHAGGSFWGETVYPEGCGFSHMPSFRTIPQTELFRSALYIDGKGLGHNSQSLTVTPIENSDDKSPSVFSITLTIEGKKFFGRASEKSSDNTLSLQTLASEGGDETLYLKLKYSGEEMTLTQKKLEKALLMIFPTLTAKTSPWAEKTL